MNKDFSLTFNIMLYGLHRFLSQDLSFRNARCRASTGMSYTKWIQIYCELYSSHMLCKSLKISIKSSSPYFGSSCINRMHLGCWTNNKWCANKTRRVSHNFLIVVCCAFLPLNFHPIYGIPCSPEFCNNDTWLECECG